MTIALEARVETRPVLPTYAGSVAIAPVVILGWDEDGEYWVADREGEPGFLGV
jgi:hypothetical protein